MPNQYRADTTLLAVRVPVALKEAAESAAKAQGLKTSELVREAIARHLGIDPTDIEAMHGRQ